MRPFFILLGSVSCLSLAFVACGDSVENDSGSTQSSPASSGASTSGSGAAGVGGSGGEGSGASGAQGGAPDTGGAGGAAVGGAPPGCMAAMGDCKSQIMDLRMKLGAAKACDPLSSAKQCQDVVDGLCCQQVVMDANSPEAICYLQTLAQVKPACMSDCTPEPCPPLAKQCLADSGTGMAACQ